MLPRQRASQIAAIVVAVVAGPASAQQLKYEKYKLPNDMTVILHEDHGLPVVCVNIWYYVGSKDEAERRTGFAHLFEHLMFMGTRRAPEGAFDTIMESGGGSNNASTSQDNTIYFSFGPSNLLPTLLWLDADRLEDLGKEMTLDKLNKQRAVVRNERRQTSEMQPYGKAELMIPEIMYPPGHPYHHPVIGSHEDLEAASVDDVKKFFATYYVPANASLVVAGDFQPANVKPLIARLFGTLPRGSDPIHKSAGPVRLDGVKRVTGTDQVQFPRTTMVYHSPAHFAPGDAELDLAAAVLGSGKSSRLYKRLVYEDKLATDVGVAQASNDLGSLFTVTVTARPDVPLDKLEATTDAVLVEFVAHGPTADELQRQQTALEVRMIGGLQSILNKADQLNQYNFHFGEPDGFARDLDRYRRATVAGVREWARKVLTPEARLIMRVLPEVAAGAGDARERPPGSSAAPAFAPQLPETFTLSNGVPVMHWQKSALPLVQVALQLCGGAALDAPEKAGATYLTVGMLDEGAADLDALAFADALEMLGATFTAAADQEAISVGLSVLKRNLDAALKLYGDAVRRPRFDRREWDREKSLHLASLKKAEDEPTAVATRVGLRAYFGDDHPYGRPVQGTLPSVGALSLDDIRACHERLFIPQHAKLFIAGDLSAAEAQAALEKVLGGWQPSAAGRQAPPVVVGQPQNKSLRVVLVDKPEAVQTVIRFYMPGPTYVSPERVPLQLLNKLLGGSFTSRLNQNLREKHGYTYGAGSAFAMGPSAGYFSAGASVRADATGAALQEFFAEFRRLRAGDVAAEEAAKGRQQRRTDVIQSFQGLSGIVATAQLLDRNGLPFSTIGADLSRLEAVDAAQLNALSRAAIPLEQALLLLVGDRPTIEKQLAGLDLPKPAVLTVTGEVRDPADSS